ncbi:MAG: hypothetical protein V4674_01040 [Patescibacteria group bacterium]
MLTLPSILLFVLVAIIALSGFLRDTHKALKTGCYIHRPRYGGPVTKIFKDRDPVNFYFSVILWTVVPLALEVGIIIVAAMVLRTQLGISLTYSLTSIGLTAALLTGCFLRIHDRDWKPTKAIATCALLIFLSTIIAMWF